MMYSILYSSLNISDIIICASMIAFGEETYCMVSIYGGELTNITYYSDASGSVRTDDISSYTISTDTVIAL